MPILVSIQPRLQHGTPKYFLVIESGYNAGKLIMHPSFISTESAKKWAEDTGYTVQDEEMPKEEIIRLAEEVRYKCVHFTMKAAKQTLMIACVGKENCTKLFAKALDARTKAQFCDAVTTAAALIRNPILRSVDE